jgi:hypothetical protein
MNDERLFEFYTKAITKAIQKKLTEILDG